MQNQDKSYKYVNYNTDITEKPKTLFPCKLIFPNMALHKNTLS